MSGKLVAEVKLVHGGESIDTLRTYGLMLETHLKIPGQVDHDMKPDVSYKGAINAYHIQRQLKFVEDHQRIQANERGQYRAVVLYSELFFRVIEGTRPEVAKNILELLCNCLAQGYLAEIIQGPISLQNLQEWFWKFGVHHPPQCKAVASDNYISGMDLGSLADAVYKQWFGLDAVLSEAYGGAGEMPLDDTKYRDYLPETVHIIQYNLNKEDIIRPLGRAFEDKLEDSDYRTSKTKKSEDPSKVIVRDMRDVRRDCEEDKTHGVLMWDSNLMRLLQENTKAKTQVEDLLQQDGNIPRQFANVLMADVELSQFQTFSPSLYQTLVQPNRVVRWNNYLGKDGLSMDFQQLAIAVYRVWIGAQLVGSKSTVNQPDAVSPTTPVTTATPVTTTTPVSPITPVQMVEPFQRSTREPVESYDMSSMSSMEMELQDMSDPDNAQRHSVERYGPRSEGQSSEGSSRNAASQQRSVPDGLPATPRRPETTGDVIQSNHVPESRPIHQPTPVSENSNRRMVTSGGNDSFNQADVLQAQQHNEHDLNSFDRGAHHLHSLDATISQLALPSAPDSSLHKPGSLRGPSYQDVKTNPAIGQPQPSNGGGNKVACSGFNSVPMNQRAIPGNVATPANAAQMTPPACQKPSEAAPPPAKSVTQTKSKDEGHKISIEPWELPRNDSNGSLQMGNPKLENEPCNGGGIPASGNQVLGQHGGAILEPMRYNTTPAAPMRNSPNTGDGDTPRQACHSLPSMAVGNAPNFKMQSGMNMAVAEGNNSLLRKIDERDHRDRMNCQEDLNERQPADGQYQTQQQQQKQRQPQPQQQTQPPQQQQQTQPQQQVAKDFGELHGDEPVEPSRPCDAPPPYCKDPSQGFASLQHDYNELKSDDNEGQQEGISNSVPRGFKPNMDASKLEENGRYNKNLDKSQFNNQNGFKRSNSSSSRGSSDPTDSNNESIVEEEEEQIEDKIDKSLLRNLDPTCVQKVKIVLDPLKTIIADWRNIAGKYGVNNELITYWRSQPVKGQGPTEHLLEHLAHTRINLKVEQFMETLTHYKRFDVLEILKNFGY